MTALFPASSPYRALARSLDALPQRYPPTASGVHLRLLAHLFQPEEAALAAELPPEPEGPAQIATRLNRDPREVAQLLKEMARKGLILTGKTAQGRLGFALMPFVVGIYEEQVNRIDAELARLFEQYFYEAFGQILSLQPQLHRVIPVQQSIANPAAVQPFESATALVDDCQSWGVQDCICRKQKALIGQGCQHPIDVCMILARSPNAFDGSSHIRALTRDEAHQTLRRAAQAGLVHSVSNNQNDLWYICNCCTCSCGLLRGMADLGLANVMARSGFLAVVDQPRCAGCGECLEACQFGAITVDGAAVVNQLRCAGCGLCVQVCPQGALALERRANEPLPPLDEAQWRAARLCG